MLNKSPVVLAVNVELDSVMTASVLNQDNSVTPVPHQTVKINR